MLVKFRFEQQVTGKSDRVKTKTTVWIRKTNYMSLFVFFISLLIVAQHVSGNHHQELTTA